MSYTPQEIEDLRDAVHWRYLCDNCPAGVFMESGDYESRLSRTVERHVRTYMLAGLKAADIRKVDTDQAAKRVGHG